MTDTQNKTAAAGADMAAFATRKAGNDGIRLSISLPDGTPTDRYLIVRNFRSDAYRAKLAEIRERLAEGGKPTDTQREADRLSLIASLVAGWNFGTDCTQANVEAFLREAQLVAEQVDRVATDDDRFFGKGSSPSSSGTKAS